MKTIKKENDSDSAQQKQLYVNTFKMNNISGKI